MSHEIDEALVRKLACPACKGNVEEENGRIVCKNSSCRKSYPIRNGIPIMLIDESETAEP